MIDAHEAARTHAAANTVDRPWAEAEFAALLDRPTTIMIGDPRSFILGSIVLDEAEVLTLATDPAHQRQGLAHAALARFCELARRRGAVSVFLEVAEDNAPACALYRTSGFVQTGRRPAYYRRQNEQSVAALTFQLNMTQG